MGEKCWICLSEDGYDWKKICKCNLRAHEQCILQWSQSIGDDEVVPCCPQCRTPIRVEQEQSIFLDLQTALKNTVASLVGGGLLTVAGSTVLSNAVYSTLYELGALSIRVMCSPSMASTALGPLYTRFGRFAPLSMPIFSFTPIADALTGKGPLKPTQIAHHLYRQVGIPFISIWLCTGGRYSSMAAGVLAAIASNIQGPERAPLLGILAARYLYKSYFNSLAKRYAASLARHLYEMTKKDEYTTAVEQFDRLMDQARANAHLENPQELGEQEMVDRMAEVAEIFNDIGEIEEKLDGSWLMDKPSFLLRISQGLLTPFVSAAIGSILGNFPALASLSTLNRNLLGMCLLVVTKDFMGLYGTYKRYCQEMNKHVLEYEDSGSEKSLLSRYMALLNAAIAGLAHPLQHLGVQIVVH